MAPPQHVGSSLTPPDTEGIETRVPESHWHGNGRVALKHGFQGYWSRRITDEHRLVYKIAEGEFRIAACRYHYDR